MSSGNNAKYPSKMLRMLMMMSPWQHEASDVTAPAAHSPLRLCNLSVAQLLITMALAPSALWLHSSAGWVDWLTNWLASTPVRLRHTKWQFLSRRLFSCLIID